MKPIRAYLQTASRLIACGHDLPQYEQINLGGFNFYRDPLFRSVNVKPGQPLPIAVDNNSYAFKLLEDKDYALALLELKRLWYNDEGNAEMLRYYISLCQYHLGDYSEVKNTYTNMVIRGIESDFVFNEMSLLIARIFMEEKAYVKARQVLKTLEYAELETTNLLMGECLLRLGKPDLAIPCFTRVIKPETDQQQVSSIQNLKTDYDALKMKKPFLAGSLSALVPGLGYLYTNKKGTAIASLLINGVFIWTAVEALQGKSYALFTATSFLGAGWYVGNIKGSAEAAVNYNLNARNDFIKSTLTNLYQ